MNQPKKPPQTAQGSSRGARRALPLPQVRSAIWEAACALVAEGHSRELSATLAGRFHTSERIIDTCLVLEGMRHQRTAATLKVGIIAALEQAKLTAAAVEDDIAEVA